MWHLTNYREKAEYSNVSFHSPTDTFNAFKILVFIMTRRGNAGESETDKIY